MFKRRLLLMLTILLLSVLIAIGAFALLNPNIFSLQQKPEPPPPKAYPYYQIINMENDRTLMYVPVTVNVGDEIISEENNRYQVVSVQENRAYARFVEKVIFEKNSPK